MSSDTLYLVCHVCSLLHFSVAVGDGEDGAEIAGEGDDAWCQVMVYVKK